jgi:hypothetical protein
MSSPIDIDAEEEEKQKQCPTMQPGSPPQKKYRGSELEISNPFGALADTRTSPTEPNTTTLFK